MSLFELRLEPNRRFHVKQTKKIMFKKYLTLILTVLVINLSLCNSVFAVTINEEKAAKLAARVKASIAELGAGKDSTVEVKLRDKTKLKGYVGQINEDSFILVDAKTGASSEIPYSQAKQVKGNNLSSGVKIAIGIGLVLVVVFLIGAYGG